MKKILLILFLTTPSFANAVNHRVDAHAPIGVMRDHIHKKGEFMASYRFSYMKMRGLGNGDKNTNQNQLFASGYMSAPTEMTMQMHMIGAMYGLSDELTVSAMGGFIDKDMHHQNRSIGRFDRDSDGISDTKINAMYQFYERQDTHAQINLGLSLPTASIDESYNSSRLPYPMQIGSGSYEFLPGLSFTSLAKKYSYGGQINGVFRLDQNKHDYKLGNSYHATTWLARKINHKHSVSARLSFTKTEAIEGLDSSLSPNMIVTADSSLQDREIIDLFLGTNYIIKSNRLAIEYGLPIYQRLKGPALKDGYRLTIGWQKLF